MEQMDSLPVLQQRTIQLLDGVGHLADDMALLGISQSIKETSQRLQSAKFTLAILGAFNRGKSMLINAMLGMKVLPTGIIPVTAAIIRIEYGPILKTVVNYKSGQSKEIPVHELEEYVTETRNPGNEKQIGYVHMAVPAEFLKSGIFLIDTPGIGSAHLESEKLTMDLIPQVDAAVLMLSVDPPICREEIKFLESLRQYIGKFFFLLNKIDYTGKDETAQAYEYTTRTIERTLDSKSIELYPVSAKKALEGRLTGNPTMVQQSQIEPFLENLSSFLMKAKGYAIMLSAVNTALRYSSEMRISLNVEEKNLLSSEDARVQACNQMETSLMLIHQREDAMFHILKGKASEIVTGLSYDLEEFESTHLPRLRDDLKLFIEDLRGPVLEKAGKADKFVRASVERLCQEYLSQEEEKIVDELKQTANMVLFELERNLNDLRKTVSEILQIQLPVIEVDFSLPSAAGFWFLFRPQFLVTETAIDIFKTALGALSKKSRLKMAEQAAWEEFDRNLGRIRSNLHDRVNESANRLEQKVQQILEETEQVMRRGLVISKEKEIEQQWTHLQQRKKLLEDIENTMREHKAYLASKM